MRTDSIIVKNAHANNLKHVDIELPKHSLVVFTGVSGSGKSSLLFDTIYTEAQRQLIETFSSFARARLPKLSRPDVDEIKHLSTPIVIDRVCEHCHGSRINDRARSVKIGDKSIDQIFRMELTDV